MKVEDSTLIYEYQCALLGDARSGFLARYSKEKSAIEKNAIIVLRYAIENILHWSPEVMRYSFNKAVIEKLKLQRVIAAISLPPEIDKDIDYVYYAHLLYPNKVPIGFKDLTLATYKRALADKICKIPKGFFDDTLGKRRALYCLRYILTQKEPCDSVEAYYDLFSKQAEAKKLLQKWRLPLALNYNWDEPIDYLHEALDASKRSDALYQLYKFSAKFEP